MREIATVFEIPMSLMVTVFSSMLIKRNGLAVRY